jgi:M6 family metalloprotease-like protein
VLQLHGSLVNAGDDEANQIRTDAAPVFSQRAGVLTLLMKANPAAALELAFPQDLVDELSQRFPASAQYLEQRGTWTGTADHLVFDDLAHSSKRYEVKVRTSTGVLDVYAAQGEPDCLSSDRVEVEGIRLNNVVAAGNTSVRNSAMAAATTVCSPQGVQNSVVILVQFPTLPLYTGVTAQGIWDIFFKTSGRSVTNYWQEVSYGKASAAGNVYGPYTVDRTYGCSEYPALQTAAIKAADANVNFANFSRIFIVMPNPGGCSWAGMATVGCTSVSTGDGTFTMSTSWLIIDWMNQTYGIEMASHEGGHNLGLNHAQSRDFGAEALGPVGIPGTFSEYGDPLSTMGYWNYGHYAAPHKVRLGWLSSANAPVTETSSSFSIFPSETPTAGVQAVKVRRGTGNNAWLWVEYRQPLGSFDSTLPSQVFTGGLIHYEDSLTGSYTQLLDFTPTTDTFADPALTGSWKDPYSDVSVSVSGAGSSALSLNVNYGAMACSRVAPKVTMSPSNVSAMAGANAVFTVSITNNDTSGCASSTFGLAATTPSGWLAVFSPASVSVAPGATGSVTLTETVVAGMLPGTYATTVTASDSSHTATASGNVSVTAPPTSLYVTTTATPNAVSVKSTVNIRAVVSNQNGPLAGATVTISVKRNGSSNAFKRTVTTDSQGTALWPYKPQQKDTYQADATSTMGAMTVTSAAAIFVAQ